MSWFDALILGIIQGLTEFLPVSSSGHIEIGKQLLGVEVSENVMFTVVVHGATVLSTIVVFWKDIISILSGSLKFKWNEETKYLAKIIVSMVPVMILGLFFKDQVEGIFNAAEYVLLIVGSMLILTAILLALTSYIRRKGEEITFSSAFLVGIAQAVAVLPGLSRSGSTIATGLLLGVKKESIAKFSFLMVLVPILGENILELAKGEFTSGVNSAMAPALITGFIAAFFSGLFACKLMINIVKRGKLIYFAIYCLIVGLAALAVYLFSANTI